MTAPQRLSLVGWKSLLRRRRRELRSMGLPFALASRTALHEVRCRALIADVIGRPAAKALELRVCEGGPHTDPVFLIPSIETARWQQISHVPGLIRLRENRP
jgi:hypothetical protein